MFPRLAVPAVVVAAGVLVGCGSSDRSSSNSEKMSEANRLVDIWKGEPISRSDPNVIAVQQHLSTLAHKCHASETQLAERLDSAQVVLEKAGIKESPVTLTERLDTAAFGSQVVAPDCAILLSSLVVRIQREKNA
jgi:hypothetical protein